MSLQSLKQEPTYRNCCWETDVTSREKGRSHNNVSSTLLALLWLLLLTIIVFLREDQQGATKLRRQSPKDKRGWRFQPLRKALISSRRRQRGHQEDVADRHGLLTAEGAFRWGGWCWTLVLLSCHVTHQCLNSPDWLWLKRISASILIVRLRRSCSSVGHVGFTHAGWRIWPDVMFVNPELCSAAVTGRNSTGCEAAAWWHPKRIHYYYWVHYCSMSVCFSWCLWPPSDWLSRWLHIFWSDFSFVLFMMRLQSGGNSCWPTANSKNSSRLWPLLIVVAPLSQTAAAHGHFGVCVSGERGALLQLLLLHQAAVVRQHFAVR